MESRDGEEIRAQAHSYLLAERIMGTLNHAKGTFVVFKGVGSSTVLSSAFDVK